MKKNVLGKSVLSVSLTAVLAGTMLSGCGGSSAKSEAAENKLSIMCWMNENDFKPVLDGFRELYPDIEIDFQNVPNEGNQYQQKLNLLANSEELPDVYWINSPIDNFAKNGYMQDISELEVVKALPDTYQDAYSFDGKVYAYAPDSWVGGMFYNKDLYAKYGFEAPNNWGEFLEQAEAFMADGIKPISMAGTQLNDLIVWLHNTEDIAKDNTLDEKINVGELTYSDVYGDVMDKWYEECVQSGIITQDMVGITDEQRIDEFASEKAAATLTGAWAISGIMEKNPNMNMGIIPYVGTEGNAYTMGAVNIGIAISTNAKHQENAEKFLAYMGSETGMGAYQKMQDSFLGADIDYEVNPIMEPMKQYAENGQFYFPSYHWTYTDSMEPIIQKGLQEIVMGTKTVDELTGELDEKIAILIESNK
ncbi:MAG: ABC transporter substrate-binding protein [Lachnospiraceae bacterium]|nr:ABC transporter substrate-binding protein [Lachnospiraceae bacterium]